MEDERDIASLKHTRKKSSLSLSGYFNRRRGFGSFDWSASTPSPSSWFRSKGQDTSPEIKPKSRMGRRRHCFNFSYDPLNYALNFEDEVVESEEFPVRSFASRLPTSPPRRNVESMNERLNSLDLRRRVESLIAQDRTVQKSEEEREKLRREEGERKEDGLEQCFPLCPSCALHITNCVSFFNGPSKNGGK